MINIKDPNEVIEEFLMEYIEKNGDDKACIALMGIYNDQIDIYQRKCAEIMRLREQQKSLPEDYLWK